MGGPEEVAMAEKQRPLLCRLGFHRWMPSIRSDNSRYRLCERCGSETSDPKSERVVRARPDDRPGDPGSFR